MRIPNASEGRSAGQPTVSPSQFRTYGAGGFMLDEQETNRGCPRRYKAKYVDRVVEDESSYPLEYGTMFHRIMELMEEGKTPEEALMEAFPVTADPEMIAEARADLDRYLQRPNSPLDLYATLDTEVMLAAPLYEDEEHGTIWIRGQIDRLAVDVETPGVVHVIDYKSNRFPPSIEAVRGDVQLKTYDYLVRQNAEALGLPKNLRVVVHLDATKWREVQVAYTAEDIENWRIWAEAVARTILRDDEARPVINPGCDWCPVQDTCPAFQGLPEVAAKLAEAEGTITDPETRLRWRNRANEIRLLLEKKVKRIDAEFEDKALDEGGMVVGDFQWQVIPKYVDDIDARRLHKAMGNEFYDVINVVKGRVKSVTADWDSHALQEVEAAFGRAPSGVKVERKKIE